jgi:rhodanese-related sulfurtransferase
VELEVEVPIPGSLLLDIREPGELASGVAEGAMLLPMNLVPHHLAELPRDRPITIYCAAGARSFGVAHWLREQGFPQAWSLAGGIGVFHAVGVPVRTPPGVVPGTRVKLPPETRADGAPLGVAAVGEVIQQLGDEVQVVVHDTQGFPVRVTVPRGSLPG